MRWLELRIPPPAVALVFGVLMWLVSLLVARIELPFVARVAVAIPSLPAPARCLALQPCAHSMYLSLLLYLLAWAVYLSSWPAVVFLPLFVLYMTQFQIKPEERTLSTLFGAEYMLYKERVRRWL